MGLPWRHSALWAFVAAWCIGVHAGYQSEVDQSKIRKIPLRSHSLSVPYLHSDMQNRYFDFGEDTIVRADQYIRLTSDRPSQDGWLFSRLPLSATNWRIEATFQIHGSGILHGDGMAMWLTKERATPGPVFGSTDNFNGLGIFIDTYKNSRPGIVFPYVMGMLGNGSVSYDKNHDGKDNELGGCSARGLRTATIPTKMRLTYFQDESLKVELQNEVVDQWTDCFETGTLKLPAPLYLGFSAETGELHDNHDIIAVETWNMHISETSDRAKTDGSGSRGGRNKASTPFSGKKGDDQSRGWGLVFIKIVLIIVVILGGYVGFTMYRASKQGSRF